MTVSSRLWVKAVGVKLEGLKELEQKLNKRFSPVRVQKIIDKGLVAGGRKMLLMVEQEQAKYKRTGATVNEATLSDPMTIGGKRIIKIHWKGSKNRFAVIHLQEQGFHNSKGEFVSPDSKGALQRVVIEGQRVYAETVRDEIARAFR